MKRLILLTASIISINSYASFSFISPIQSANDPVDNPVFTITQITPNNQDLLVSSGTHSLLVSYTGTTENPCANLAVKEFDRATDTHQGKIETGVTRISSDAIVNRIGPGATCLLSMDIINDTPYVTGPIALSYNQTQGIYEPSSFNCVIDYTITGTAVTCRTS